MNKKASKIISIYFVLIILFTAIILIGANLMLSSSLIDIREIESRILAVKISNCLTGRGYVSDEILSDDFNDESLMQKCYVDLKDSIFPDKSYLSVRFLDTSDKEIRKEISLGNKEIKSWCFNQEEAKLPRCSEVSVLALSNKGKINIVVFTGINKGVKDAKD